ncbi:MAG TPA: Rrf2 family transcriptional regulator [Clostridiales bacterium]|nr:Rrf2 family transcriptional regulator [Clostridiales bacterium]HOL91086.1 Rrf2 family transcriptional regulator [Clostridiales bacterium]HPP35228.1 Rrf2 family transcriptional regulator [Clostridiales bacterium]
MRISAKGRYALAAVINMAQQYDSGECITVISISERLGISKIYLEQVFSMLKRGDIVRSVKGAQGGYQLVRPPEQITVLDVLSAVETSLFEAVEDTVPEKAPEIEAAMRSSVFEAMDRSLSDALSRITLEDLVLETEKYSGGQSIMYYI